jgi:hypothetical protein
MSSCIYQMAQIYREKSAEEWFSLFQSQRAINISRYADTHKWKARVIAIKHEMHGYQRNYQDEMRSRDDQIEAQEKVRDRARRGRVEHVQIAANT